MPHPYLIAPSLLSANFARLGEDASQVLAAGADLLHLDVMDNHYVPNLTVGPMVCKALRDFGIMAPIDVHLMTDPVDQLIESFAKAGATNITIHPDASRHLDRSLSLIRQLGCKAGIALNPATSLDTLSYILDHLDLVLVMSVNPGFGGQAFIPSALKKIEHMHEMISAKHSHIRIAVDGGINTANIATVAKAGADMFIAGSAIFNAPDYRQVISDMRVALTVRSEHYHG